MGAPAVAESNTIAALGLLEPALPPLPLLTGAAVDELTGAPVDELTGALGLVATAAHDGDDAGEIDDLVARRQAAREAKDFAEADRIRDELHERGIEVEDTAAGPVWHRL